MTDEIQDDDPDFVSLSLTVSGAAAVVTTFMRDLIWFAQEKSGGIDAVHIQTEESHD